MMPADAPPAAYYAEASPLHKCMVQVAYHEAGTKGGLEAYFAVLQVADNRAVASGRGWCKAVYSAKQFSPRIKSRMTDHKKYQQASQAVREYLKGSRMPSMALATHFYSASLKKPPYWARKMRYLGKVGGNVFLTEKRR